MGVPVRRRAGDVASAEAAGNGGGSTGTARRGTEDGGGEGGCGGGGEETVAGDCARGRSAAMPTTRRGGVADGRTAGTAERGCAGCRMAAVVAEAEEEGDGVGREAAEKAGEGGRAAAGARYVVCMAGAARGKERRHAETQRKTDTACNVLEWRGRITVKRPRV